jgi:predicted RNA methylase
MSQTTGLSRDVIDKYYTSVDTVSFVLETIKKNIVIENVDIIIEPSAGNGAFIAGIKSMSNDCYFYDILPEHNDIIEQDFLKFEFPLEILIPNKRVHVIGNPPFGRQSSIAVKFIKKCAQFCDTISFILPKSFKKDSLKKNFPVHFHNVVEIDLPKNSFLVNDIEYDVPSILQIWEKKSYARDVPIKLEPYNFTFVKKNESPHLSFRRVGVNAGIIDKNIKEKSTQSHYFIKFKVVIDDDTINALNNIVYQKDNTVGPRSISKQELIVRFNPILEQLYPEQLYSEKS